MNANTLNVANVKIEVAKAKTEMNKKLKLFYNAPNADCLMFPLLLSLLVWSKLNILLQDDTGAPKKFVQDL